MPFDELGEGNINPLVYAISSHKPTQMSRCARLERQRMFPPAHKTEMNQPRWGRIRRDGSLG
jgi:hypothetical protein